MKIPAKNALFGAAYGLALVALSTVIGGGGHGFCIPAVIAEAPLPFSADFPMSIPVGLVSTYVLLGPPLLWAAIAVFAQTSRRWLFPSVIAIHYASSAFYAAHYWNDDFNDPYRDVVPILHHSAPYLATYAAVYLCGQLWLWRNFVKYSPPRSLFAD